MPSELILPPFFDWVSDLIVRLNSTNFPLLHEKGKQLDLPKYDKCSRRAWLQAELLRALIIERLMKEAQFFPSGDSRYC